MFLKRLFKKKKPEIPFTHPDRFSHYSATMMELRAEIKALKRYVPSDVVDSIEVQMMNVLKNTCRYARDDAFSFAAKKASEKGMFLSTLTFNVDSFDNNVYVTPNAIFEGSNYKPCQNEPEPQRK